MTIGETIKIAVDCGAEEGGFYRSITDSSVSTFTLTSEQLEAFAKAVIAAYVAEQKPVPFIGKLKEK